MNTREKWEEETPILAYLVALDISGFSKDPSPDQLLGHRYNFLRAIETTRLFSRASKQADVKAQFLGDELRLTFNVQIIAGDIRDFIRHVFEKLDSLNEGLQEQDRTKVKGVVLKGSVIWKTWYKCPYVSSALPFKAQMWMGQLAPNEIAIDEEFRESLAYNGRPTNFRMTTFFGETGYHLL